MKYYFDYEYLDSRGEKHYSWQKTNAESKEKAVQLLKNIAKAFGYEITAVTFEDLEGE